MAALAARALGTLPRLRHSAGPFSWEVADGDPALRGESVRYTLIVLLGLLRARARRLEPPFDLTELRGLVDRSLQRPGSAELVPRLSAALGAQGGWIMIGLAVTAERGEGGKLAGTMLEAARNQLLGTNRTESWLFRHSGAPLAAARRAAGVLLGLQLADGGWPWLYDVERARLVERYEVYSVHQHGMAPMALDELGTLSGEPRYTAAAQAGLPWRNQLGRSIFVPETGMTHRSIRRRRPFDRARLVVDVAGAATGRSPGRAGWALETNRSCRPFELGWLIEAWGSREPEYLAHGS
jgi:hypothetical protein